MSISPKNSRSRGSSSLKRNNRNGSRTARNNNDGVFNFKIEVMADANASEELLRSSKRQSKAPSTSRFKNMKDVVTGIEELPQQESPRMKEL